MNCSIRPLSQAALRLNLAVAAARIFERRFAFVFLALALFLGLAGCARPPYIWAAEVPAERAAPPEQSKLIQRADVVSLSVVGQELLSGQHTVGADGTIAVANVGSVLLAGKSTQQAEAELTRRLQTLFAEPKVSVVVVSRHIEVGILGEVQAPGKYPLASGDSVVSALAVAGGVTEFGNENAIFLIRASEPVRVRFRMKDLVRGGKSASSFPLRDGDLLVVE